MPHIEMRRAADGSFSTARAVRPRRSARRRQGRRRSAAACRRYRCEGFRCPGPTARPPGRRTHASERAGQHDPAGRLAGVDIVKHLLARLQCHRPADDLDTALSVRGTGCAPPPPDPGSSPSGNEPPTSSRSTICGTNCSTVAATTRATPLCTSTSARIGVERGQGRSSAPAQSQRGTATPSTSASGRRIRSAPLTTARLHTSPAASPPSAARAVSPASPHSGISTLASLSLTLERSTNIDSRFSNARSKSAVQASRISSSPRLQMTKLASNRPFGEQYPASRACPASRCNVSCVN